MIHFIYLHLTSSHLLLELPEKQCLRFPCGVEVEVSFSALFSNVLVIFATVKTISPQAQDCTVALSSTPVNIYFFIYFQSLTCVG